MARELLIILRCDAAELVSDDCEGETAELEAFDGLTIALCDGHRASLFDPLRTIVDKAGYRLETAPAAPAGKGREPADPDRWGPPVACLSCGRESVNGRALNMHYRNRHRATISEIYGIDCPGCSYTAPADVPQALGSHISAKHDAVTVAGYFAELISSGMGRPEVIAAAQARARDLPLLPSG